jgi:DNA-binding transcriptional MocR family regulator
VTDTAFDLFARISHSRTADEVVRQIELLLLEGVLRDGDRLPGERELSKRLDVSLSNIAASWRASPPSSPPAAPRNTTGRC